MKRRQQVLKPRGSPDMVVTLKPSLSAEWGQYRRDRPLARDCRFGRGFEPGQRHRMDRLGTSHGEARVKGAIHPRRINTPVSCRAWVHSFVRPALRAFFRPDRRFHAPPRARRIKAGRVFRGHPKGLALYCPSTAVTLTGSGFKAAGTCAGTSSFIPASAGRHSYAEPQAGGSRGRGATIHLRIRNTPVAVSVSKV